MGAKKARGVEPSKAIRFAFEAFGLDPQNQSHWDILLGVLASARPKKKRGRPPRWTETEVAEFHERVASALREILQNLNESRNEHEPSKVLLEWMRAKHILSGLAALARLNRYKKNPIVFQATVIAMCLQRQGHYRHMTEASLTKYVLCGPSTTKALPAYMRSVRTRSGK
jgi:hypothetical protein